MTKKNKQIHLLKRRWNTFLRSVKRAKRFKKRIAGLNRYRFHMNMRAIVERRFKRKPVNRINFRNKHSYKKPNYPRHIEYLLSIPHTFSNKKFNNFTREPLKVPTCFSLVDNHEESFNFLKQLLVILHHDRTMDVIIDYSNCTRIDVDASICMDIVLSQFINYFNKCQNSGFNDLYCKSIYPINYDKM